MALLDSDIIVVPAISLNPKKARRSSKRAAQKTAPATAPRLPADTPLAAPPKPAAKLFEPMPVRCLQGQNLASASVVATQPTPGRKWEAAGGPKRSWFEITEDDDDSFLGAAPKSRPNRLVSIPEKPVAAEVPQAFPLHELPVEAVANVFLFTEISAVGRSAAACSTLKSGIWDVADFWQAYGGPNFAPTPDATRSLSSLRGAFRRWVHGLEGDWGFQFAEAATLRHHADVFDDAAYMLAGLQRGDEVAGGVQAQAFAGALVDELGCFDASCEKTKSRAYDAVVRTIHRAGLLPEGTAQAAREAFEESVERGRPALLGMPLRTMAVKRPAAVSSPGQGAQQSLAHAALSALGARHEGLGVEAALRAVSEGTA